jgi:hypothetical protein
MVAATPAAQGGGPQAGTTCEGRTLMCVVQRGVAFLRQ